MDENELEKLKAEIKAELKAEIKAEFFNYERLEGLDEIRQAIDPKMTKTRFYTYHRKDLQPILIEYEGWWRRRPRIRYFTFRRLLVYHLMKRGKV